EQGTRYELAHYDFHGFVPCGRGGCTFYVQLESSGSSNSALVDYREPGGRYGLPQTADPSWLQDAEVGGIPADRMRGTRNGRRTYFMGSNASHPPCAYGSSWRSAHAARWRLVGTHWLDVKRPGPKLRSCCH